MSAVSPTANEFTNSKSRSINFIPSLTLLHGILFTLSELLQFLCRWPLARGTYWPTRILIPDLTFISSFHLFFLSFCLCFFICFSLCLAFYLTFFLLPISVYICLSIFLPILLYLISFLVLYFLRSVSSTRVPIFLFCLSRSPFYYCVLLSIYIVLRNPKCITRVVFNTEYCRIWGSHGDDYEDGCILGCSAV
jgi:hypothetical protein